MSLDTSTLYLVAAMVAAMLGAMLLFFGRQENIPALIWWGAAYLLGAASVAPWSLAGCRLRAMASVALDVGGVGDLLAGFGTQGDRALDGRLGRYPERDVQSPRLGRGRLERDRTRSQ